ncbi:MAG: zinc ribbon domain-containing protein [Bacteroidales bacterium]|nr:zinc ribbon domain-containing protein [Bacteroidales bacterium]
MENNYQDPAQRAPKQPDQASQQQSSSPPLPNQTSPPPQQQPPQQQAPPPPQQAPPQQQAPQPQYQQPQAQYQTSQPQYQQPQQPQAQNYNAPKLYPPIKTGEWIGVMIIMMIPIINFIMLLVWAFGTGNPNKSNWAKATLLIGIITSVLIFAVYLIVFLVAGISMNL